MEIYQAGVGVTVGAQMLKWDLLDQEIHRNPLKLPPNTHVNVFINLESVFRNLSMYKNLQELIALHKQKVLLELESSILNLVASYRSYFKKEKCLPSVYLYYTKIDFEKQQMEVYNKHYRNYYQNRFLQNSQNRSIGNLLNDSILPELKIILNYTPGCYLIESNTFDSSLIPKILSSDKNVLISSDIFDTLYLDDPRFIVIYIKRRYSNFSVISEREEVVRSVVKDSNPFDLTIFNSELYYKLLLSIKGSKIRNIKSAKWFGYTKFLSILKSGLEKGIVLENFTCIDSVLELFPTKYQADIKSALQCTDLDTQYGLLSETDIQEIRSQVIDKSDAQSLLSLNNQRFLDFPISISGLIE